MSYYLTTSDIEYLLQSLKRISKVILIYQLLLYINLLIIVFENIPISSKMYLQLLHNEHLK